MPCIVVTTLLTTTPPFTAISDAVVAISLACRALSKLAFAVAVICSMLLAVVSSDAACCSVRMERSLLPLAISVAPTLIDSVLARTQQRAHLVVAAGIDRIRQVARSDPLKLANRLPDRFDDCVKQRMTREC